MQNELLGRFERKHTTEKKARTNIVKRRRPQKFRDIWLLESDFKNWLTRDLDSKYKAKCTLCKTSLTSEIAVIRNHAKTRSHMLKIESISKNNQQTIDTFVGQNKITENSISTSVKRAEIKLCGFMVDHNIPFRVILKDLQLKSTKATAIVKNVLGESQKEILTKKLQSTKFSILIDESTDISAIKTLCIIVRFYDAEEGKVVSRFWELCQIFEKDTNIDKASAEHLFNFLVASFEKRDVPFANVIGFASDGCSTMMGCNNSVASRFQSYCRGISIFKCICHSMHLCASEACKAFPRACEDLARNVYNFFKSSSKRQFELQQFQSFLDLKIHKMLHPSQTRWLSLEAVVKRLIEQWEALKLFFIEKRFTERLAAVDTILFWLDDPLFRMFYLFLEWVLPKFTQLNKLFQSEKPVITTMYDSISSTYIELLKSYMDSDYINKTDIQNIDPSKADKFLSPEQMYLGVKVATFLQKPDIQKNNNLKTDFWKNTRQFLVVGCLQIKKRFDFNDVVLQKMSALQPENAMMDKTRKTVPSLLPLMQCLPRIVNAEEYQAIDDEWRKLPRFELPGDINVTDQSDIFWHKLANCDENDQIGYSFKNLAKFVLNVISLPHSNAECERTFSAVNLIKTKTRNKLVTPTVNGVLLASQRVKKNCIAFEPVAGEYKRMTKKTLYPKSLTNCNAKSSNINDQNQNVDDLENQEDFDEISILY
ncbi:uncharacterized protein [Venturia canescens]|uniref:uncharacterized protein n=1 Tax=Venturia canescens TaxID=32260 RepID=UPI001C9D034A|nr:uncharacterized protein LOC122408456 [Venturia canescens]